MRKPTLIAFALLLAVSTGAEAQHPETSNGVPLSPSALATTVEPGLDDQPRLARLRRLQIAGWLMVGTAPALAVSVGLAASRTDCDTARDSETIRVCFNGPGFGAGMGALVAAPLLSSGLVAVMLARRRASRLSRTETTVSFAGDRVLLNLRF